MKVIDEAGEALAKYNARYSDELYNRVRAGLCVNTANRIIDAALDVCGSPHHRGAERRIWEYARRKFSEDRCRSLGLFLSAFRSAKLGVW